MTAPGARPGERRYGLSLELIVMNVAFVVLVGAIVWLLASLVGAIETSWWSGRPARRSSAVVAIMLVQSALGFWLRRTFTL